MYCLTGGQTSLFLELLLEITYCFSSGGLTPLASTTIGDTNQPPLLPLARERKPKVAPARGKTNGSQGTRWKWRRKRPEEGKVGWTDEEKIWMEQRWEKVNSFPLGRGCFVLCTLAGRPSQHPPWDDPIVDSALK